MIVICAAAALGSAVLLPGVHARRDATTTAADTSITSQSIAFFEAKLENDPRNIMAASRLADRYVLRFQRTAHLEDIRRAHDVVAAVLPLYADKAGAHARLSALELMQHGFADAYASARAALEIDPTDQGAIGAVFDAAMATGRYELADSMLTKLQSGTMGWRLRQVHWLDATGHSDQAFALMERACEQFERKSAQPAVVAWCRTELGGIDRGLGDDKRANVQYERALRALPDYRAALEGLADLAHARGDWREAEGLYARIIADAHPDLYLRLAETRRAQGREADAAEAERAFLRIARAPGAEPLYAHYLSLYYAERPVTRDSAVAIALRDVERRPAVESWDILSWAYFRRGDLEPALIAAERASAWGAPSATMDYHRARILEAMGRDDVARPLLKKAIADPALLDPATRMLLRMGDAPAAIALR
jgi:tetratricopeptide (TPR) repeat protein